MVNTEDETLEQTLSEELKVVSKVTEEGENCNQGYRRSLFGPLTLLGGY